MATFDRVRGSSGGFHYAWVIIAILSIVQIFGQSISMSAGDHGSRAPHATG